MKLIVLWLPALTIFLFAAPDLSSQGRTASEGFVQRRERIALETIRKQAEASGAVLKASGPFLPNVQQVARRLQALLPEGRIQDEGKFGPRPAWKRVELLTRGWEVEMRAMPEMDSAAREMAQYLAFAEAAFRPGTMSGVSVGQARYFFGPTSIVFLRQNLIVWVRERNYPSRIWPPAIQMAKECEELALKVDRELLNTFARK